MIHASSIRGLGLTAGILFVIGAGTAFAQIVSNCPLQPTVSTERRTLNCQPGLSITVERGAHFHLADRNRDGRVDAIVLDSKAALVDVDSSRVQGGFEVVTPQAIAAVRGTRWAVDVQRGKTSVLVLRGRVAVNKVSTGRFPLWSGRRLHAASTAPAHPPPAPGTPPVSNCVLQARA